jgi:NTE family protein
MTGPTERRAAIACQGGGSHTAFTAGVLRRLLGDAALDGYRIVGFSGTSGGAICALLAWYATLDGGPDDAAELLDGFWADNSTSTPVEVVLNAAAVWAATLQSLGALPAISPYDAPVSGLHEFRALLERWVDFGRIDVDRDGRHPLLLIGAVDVLSGCFRAFHSRHDRITADTVLASTAIPTLFPAVHIDDNLYWDGLFSQNPPVRELLDAEPDELWVVQINPTRSDTEPRSVLDIADRRNELAGNLSLYQELHVIEKINQLIADGLLTGGRYKQVVVRVLELARPRSSRVLGPASKLNRDPAFIRDLMSLGERQAAEFLTALTFEQRWRQRDAASVVGFLAEDVELISQAPFPEHGTVRGPAAQGVLRDLMAEDLQLDLARKQLARERVTWTMRIGEDGARGRVEAQFRDGRIVRLALTGTPD